MMDLWYGLDSKFGRFLRDCNEIVEAIWRWDSALYDVRNDVLSIAPRASLNLPNASLVYHGQRNIRRNGDYFFYKNKNTSTIRWPI